MGKATPVIIMPGTIKQKLPQPKTVLVWGNSECLFCHGSGIHRTVKKKGVMLSVCPTAYVEVVEE